MTKYAISFATVFVFLGMVVAGLAEDTKIAVVDMDRLIQENSEAQRMESVLKKQVAEFEEEQEELEKREESLKKDAEELAEAAEDPALSKSAQSEKREELKKKVMEFLKQ